MDIGRVADSLLKVRGLTELRAHEYEELRNEQAKSIVKRIVGLLGQHMSSAQLQKFNTIPKDAEDEQADFVCECIPGFPEKVNALFKQMVEEAQR